MSWRPRLRPHVTLTPEGLRDAAFARAVPAGPLTRALAARLDGSRDLAELRREVADATGEPAAEVDGALRALLLLNLVADAEPGAADALVAARLAAEAQVPALRVLPGARFGCVGSGQCCRVFRPGPLNDADVARLEAAAPELRAAWPELPPPPWVEEREGEDGARGRYLLRAADGGRCVFLRDDGRCGVHAAVGPEAKPDPCRLFPFDAVRTLEDLRVFDVASCSAQGRASAQGPTHAEHAAALAPLLPARPRLFHPLVLLGPGLPCDYGFLLPLEAELAARVEARGTAGLSAGLRAARAFCAEAAGFPLDPGQPSEALAAALRAEAPADGPDRAQAVYALARVTEALERAAAVEAARAAPAVAAFGEACGVLRSLTAAEAGLADGPLPASLAAAAALPVDEEAAEALLASSLRNRLFGRRLLVRGHLRAGLLRLALLGPLTVAAARVHAAGRGAARVEGPDLDLGHWLVALALTRPALEAALVEVEDACWAVGA